MRKVIEATLHEKPPGQTHWSVRSMARAQGISPAAVQRIWAAHGLKPHLVKTFKLSNDPRFVEKLRDVVGLYRNPPVERACAVRGREEPDPGSGPDPAGLAAQARPRGNDDPRLQAQRNDDVVRCAERVGGHGDRGVHGPAAPPGVSPFPQAFSTVRSRSISTCT